MEKYGVKGVNEFHYATGKVSKNNFYDISLKQYLTHTYMELFSLTHHMYSWPENNSITQESLGISSRGLDKKSLKKLEKDLLAMARKCRNYRKYGANNE